MTASMVAIPWPWKCSAARRRKVPAGGVLLVGENFGVGQPQIIIDQGMQIVESASASAVSISALSSAMGPPATAVRDATELIDVHVHQLAGTAALVSQGGGFRRSDHLAGHRVAVAQVGSVPADGSTPATPCGGIPPAWPQFPRGRSDCAAAGPRSGSPRCAECESWSYAAGRTCRQGRLHPPLRTG